tara:strand:+ start:10495 stop:11874 length:1380 start_codon:yes stop_codon:yes gene_type:complete
MNNRLSPFLLTVILLASAPAAAQEQSKSMLTSKAMHGDTQAQYDLCRYYQKERSADFALSWCEKAAMSGHRTAQLQLAWLAIRHAENEDGLKKGYIWLSVALAQGYDFSGYHEWKGLSAHFAKDEKTLKALNKDADQYYKKYVDPLEERATFERVTENKTAYVATIKQKAEHGDAEAQALLGTLAEYDGDLASALEWYKKAATNGYVDAQSYLGRALPDEGIGTLYDDTQRYAWMSVALSQHYNYVDKLSLSLLAERLGAKKRATAQALAQDYYNQSVQNPEQVPVTELIKRAEDKYMQALIDNAQNGRAASQYELSQKYKSGIAILKDLQKSMEWHIKAAEGGNILAQYTLGHMYEEGIELPKDSDQSAKWYRKAAMQGYSPAQFSLGQLYFNNRASARSNIIEAYAWFDVASKRGHTDAEITRNVIAKSFSKEETRLSGILARKYYRLYAEPFETKK